MSSSKMNPRAREFLGAAMASGCAVAMAHDAGATTVIAGQNGVPVHFGAEFSSAYVLPAGTTEVIGTIGMAGTGISSETIDWFEFKNLPAGNFTIDVTSVGNAEFGVFGDVYTSNHSLIAENYGDGGAPFSLTGMVPGDGEIVVGLGGDGLPNFDAQISPASAAPEPETWTLMMGGALAAGAMLRRKRRLTLKAAEAAA